MSFKVREVFNERIKQEKVPVELREQAYLDELENNNGSNNTTSPVNNTNSNLNINEVKKPVAAIKASSNIKDYLSDLY